MVTRAVVVPSDEDEVAEDAIPPPAIMGEADVNGSADGDDTYKAEEDRIWEELGVLEWPEDRAAGETGVTITVPRVVEDDFGIRLLLP